MTPASRAPRGVAPRGAAASRKAVASPGARARGAAGRDAGLAAEDFAARWLARRGLVLVARNVRSRVGEIDLVMREGEVLVFVEVRMRRSRAFGGAAASIDAAKRLRLLRAARLYVARLSPTPPCRFDAVLLDRLDDDAVEWQRNAIEDAA